MPFDYHIDTSLKRAVIKARGPVDIEQVIDIADKHISDPLWKPGYDVLVDYQDAEHFEMSNEYTQRFSDYLDIRKSELGNARIACVMPHNFMFASAKVLQTMAENFLKVYAFREHDDALAWLAEDKH